MGWKQISLIVIGSVQIRGSSSPDRPIGVRSVRSGTTKILKTALLKTLKIPEFQGNPQNHGNQNCEMRRPRILVKDVCAIKICHPPLRVMGQKYWPWTSAWTSAGRPRDILAKNFLFWDAFSIPEINKVIVGKTSQHVWNYPKNLLRLFCTKSYLDFLRLFLKTLPKHLKPCIKITFLENVKF